MKLRKSLRFANSLLLNVALLFGASNASAWAAASDVQQIYSWPTIVSKTVTAPVIVTKGVTYQNIRYQTQKGPISIHETWVDLDDPNVAVKTVMSHDKLENETNETVSQMAKRTGAVTGVNGDFFESGTSGMALNMTVNDGQLLHSPTQSAVLGIDANNKVTLGKFSFTGTLTAANGKTSAINALNGHPVSFPNGMVLLTPELGYWEMASNATVLSLQKQADADTYKVVAIDPAKQVVEAPYPNSVKLLAQGKTALDFVTANVRMGDLMKVAYSTNPSTSGLKYAIGGGPILLKGGAAYSDPNPPLNQPNYQGPLTGVGLTSDGKHLLQIVVDGRTSESIGLTYGQMTNYLVSIGVTDAMLLDGGGSSVMTVREPGDTVASVQNKPSDGTERRPANGLFVYSTSPSGQPTHVTVNNDQALSVFKGTSATVGAFVRDENYNPLPGASITYSLEPETLGTITQAGSFTAAETAGTGKIVVTAENGARGEVPVTVFDTVDSMAITPQTIDLGNDESVAFKVTGKFQGKTISLKPEYLTWTVSDSSLGRVTPAGVFTAASGTKRGAETVTAKLGSKSVAATLSVGYVQKTLDSLEDASKWVRSNRWGEVGTLSTAADQKQGDKKASLAVNYSFPAGSGTKQFVFYPKDTLYLPSKTDNAAVNPIGIGAWVYGDNSGGLIASSFEKPDGTLIAGNNVVRVNWTGWKFITFKFPSGAVFPLKLDFLAYSVESPEKDLKGSLYWSDLQVLYAARNYSEKPKVITFADIQTHWGKSVIETLATKGIVKGDDATHFAPDRGLSRAEAVSLIVRAIGLPDAASDKFSDVSSGEWYAKSVGAAVNAGIVNGIGDGKFAPNDPVDRNQASVMIYNALKVKSKAPTGGTPLVFKDESQIASWAQADINALSAAGLMKGDGAGHLEAAKTTTRAEAAAMIFNMMNYSGLL